MSKELLFCPGEDFIFPSPQELARSLAAKLGSPRAIDVVEDGTAIEVAEFGITLSLIFNAGSGVIGAMTTLHSSVNLDHVDELCKAFRALGWEF